VVLMGWGGVGGGRWFGGEFASMFVGKERGGGSLQT